ncbi:hypothetical protein VP01_4001g3 [Puccinia sorghi]|uniref:Uncharacterized protein n=1 Tax=Puccinia sorghi TaxID=27349 RepID=A0A0L6UTW2_9BASI|nr:hypothetical protein VP01_4001g3 [Puccinia sorghi]
MTTISHILAPLVDELLLLNTGIFIKTPQFPNGRKLSIHLGALIGDIVATHKIAGFASHSVIFFCSWCKCEKEDMSNMHIVQRQTRRETRIQAHKWRESSTLAEQTGLLKMYGTRWSELNRLTCWDPTMNVALGIMHNYRLDYWEDDGPEDTDENIDFQDSSLIHIRKEIKDIFLPRGITEVTCNLGEPKAGKLKASECYSLFSTYLPLALIDFFGNTTASGVTNSNQNRLLNFTSLVVRTNIVASKTISINDADRFSQAYLIYIETAKLVFPSPKILPNHHYSLHFPEQMKWWGPLSNVSKFAGERINGTLKKMRTNGIIGECQVEGTMLQEFCQIQRFVSQKPAKFHPTIYAVILEKLQFKYPNVEDYQSSHHTTESQVLSPFVKDLQSCKSPSGFYISKSKQNSLVEYQKDGKAKYGWVTHIYSLVELDGRVIVVVKSAVDAPTGDQLAISEGFVSTLGDLQLKVVVNDGDYKLLDPGEVTAICAYRHLPAWTFWHSKPLIVLRPIPHIHSPLLCPSSSQS